MPQTQNDPAFEVIEVNMTTGTIILAVKKGIAGPLANQLKNTGNRRKGSSIIRKLGYVLSSCGDILYGKRVVEETEVDPAIVIDAEILVSDQE